MAVSALQSYLGIAFAACLAAQEQDVGLCADWNMLHFLSESGELAKSTKSCQPFLKLSSGQHRVLTAT